MWMAASGREADANGAAAFDPEADVGVFAKRTLR